MPLYSLVLESCEGEGVLVDSLTFDGLWASVSVYSLSYGMIMCTLTLCTPVKSAWFVILTYTHVTIGYVSSTCRKTNLLKLMHSNINMQRLCHLLLEFGTCAVNQIHSISSRQTTHTRVPWLWKTLNSWFKGIMASNSGKEVTTSYVWSYRITSLLATCYKMWGKLIN